MPEQPKRGFLRNLRIKRVSLVDMGANFDRSTGDGAHIMLYKSAGPGLGSVHVDRPMGKDGVDEFGCPCPDCDGADIEEYEKANLDAESRSKIPDSKFLAVWTDEKGKKHRKLPVQDAGHLAAARGRIDQTQMPADVKAEAHRKLERLSPKSDTNKETRMKLADVLKMFGKAATETDAAKRTELLAKAEEAAGQLTEGQDKLDPAHVEATKAAYGAMNNAIKAFGPGPHPPSHPIHGMRDQMTKMGDCLKAAGAEVPSDEPGALGTTAAKEFVAKQVEKETASLRAQLEKALEKGERAEMVTLLKSFKATPFKMEGDDNDVDGFMKMKKSMGAVQFDALMTRMKTQDEQMANSDLFKSVGSGRRGSASAEAQLQAKADAIMSKSTEKITKEAAYDQACMENPGLVHQLRREEAEAAA